MADQRAYVMLFVEGTSSFIALNGTHIPENIQSALMYIEDWKGKDHILKLYRVAYSKKKANEWMNLMYEGKLNMMEGPDLYCLIDENEETILTIWKTKMPEFVEISMDKKTKLVSSDVSKESLFDDMLRMLEASYGKLERIRNEKNAYLLEWKF